MYLYFFCFYFSAVSAASNNSSNTSCWLDGKCIQCHSHAASSYLGRSPWPCRPSQFRCLRVTLKTFSYVLNSCCLKFVSHVKHLSFYFDLCSLYSLSTLNYHKYMKHKSFISLVFLDNISCNTFGPLIFFLILSCLFDLLSLLIHCLFFFLHPLSIKLHYESLYL